MTFIPDCRHPSRATRRPQHADAHVVMTRTHGWGPIGKRVHGVVPRNRGRVTTLLGALSIDGVEAMMTVEGGTTAEVFLKFIDEHLKHCNVIKPQPA